MRRVALCLLALAALLPASAGAKTIHFRGEKVGVPAGWPVFRLAERPHMCVRLDRRAVYLGRPGSAQRCPAGAIGRRRAILVDPGARARAEASRVPPAHLSAASEYTGLGFDACTAPSRRSMAAWAALALPGDRRLHRRPQPRLLAAEPDRELGRRTDGGGLEPDPDLRRPAGADLELQLLRQAEHVDLHRRDPGDRSGDRRGRPGAHRRDRRRQPDLLRHGELLAHRRAPPTRR